LPTRLYIQKGDLTDRAGTVSSDVLGGLDRNTKGQKPNMVTDLLSGKKCGREIIDGYIESHQKNKQRSSEFKAQKEKSEGLRKGMKEDRQKAKVEA